MDPTGRGSAELEGAADEGQTGGEGESQESKHRVKKEVRYIHTATSHIS